MSSKGMCVVWAGLGFLLASSPIAAADFSWQKPHATVVPTGDLKWAPQPFAYAPGKSVIYIDYEKGDDNNSGTDKTSPFKHHPWDPEAKGAAAATAGIKTYVFKRGVMYRGTLRAKESGQEGDPIRLTSDPAWGSGEACLFGSERITGGWKRCTAADAPKIPAPEKVWYLDLPFAITDNPYESHPTLPKIYTEMVVELKGADFSRIDLAREPNWTITNFNYPLQDWWDVRMPGPKSVALPKKFPQTAAADWIGGTFWATWGEGSGGGANMATVQQGSITKYDNGVIDVDILTQPGNKFFIENLPQLLDSPNEFYYSPTAPFPRRLYVRLSGDRDPNSTIIEVGVRPNIIQIVDKRHIVISGLTLALNNQPRPGTASPEPPHWNCYDGSCQAVELSGTCSDIEISNCKFLYVVMGIAQRRAGGSPPNSFADVRITDNDLAFVEDQGITLCNTGESGRRISVLRNRLHNVGFRQTCRNYSLIPAINLAGATSVEIAGNMVDYCCGTGINGDWKTGDQARPGSQIRVLVHHNKATNTALGLNDYGGIEGWQDGPAFFYCNVSGNSRGYRPFSGENIFNPWGHAIYFDHARRHIAFNNIVWGIHNSTTRAAERNNSGFMQAVAVRNFFANNTLYNLYRGFCQADSNETGCVGNLLDNISFMYHDQYSGNPFAFASNVYGGAPQSFSSRCRTIEDFRKELVSMKSRSSTVGVAPSGPVLANPAKGDFRPTGGAIGKGARVFLPWNLARVVGEWHFWANPADQTTVTSDNEPGGGSGNVLKCAGATEASYVAGDLENWTSGALRFDGTGTFCAAANSAPFDMATNSFIIEAYVKTAKGGVIVSKIGDKGYALDIPASGKARVRLLSGSEYALSSKAGVKDDKWHHILAEIDRSKGQVNLYVDGQLSNGEAAGAVPAAGASLANPSEFLVGKDAAGNFFGGEIDFLRVARSSFAESDTSLEELYAWEFDGPAVRDFTGKKVSGPRDAGAIQHSQGSGAP